MKSESIGVGVTIAEALDAALDDLGVQQDAVEYEVLEEQAALQGGRGPAVRVRAWVRPEALAELGGSKDSGGDVEGEYRVHEDEAEGLTDEELDEIADTAIGAIGSVLRSLGIDADVDEYEGDEGEIILDIVGADLGLLIGRHGRTLDALQVLVGSITNRRLGRRYPVVVDVSGYRHRRRGKLEEIARKAAEKAVQQRRPVALRPMTSYDRRVVHMALREDRRVVTESEGQEPARMVVVKPHQGRR